MMPTISSFYGIAVRLYYHDDAPPHVHAHYKDREAAFALSDCRVLGGALSPRAEGLVAEWIGMHRDALEEAWTRAARQETLEPLQPLE